MTFETPEDLAKFVLDALNESYKSVEIVEHNYEDLDSVTQDELAEIFRPKFEDRDVQET